MSRCFLMGAGVDGDVRYLQTYQNAYGLSPRIWTALAVKYRNEFPFSGIPTMDWEAVSMWAMDPASSAKHRMLGGDWNVLAMTWVGVYIGGRQDIITYISDLQVFAEENKPEDGQVDHLSSIVRDLKVALDDGLEYFMYHSTSVDSNPWSLAGEGEDEVDTYNIPRDLDKPLYGFPTLKATQLVLR